MLKNFVKTSDLKRYYPTLDQNLWKGSNDFSLQITQAFEMVSNDLWSRGINPRQVMLPVSIATGSGTLVPSNFKRLSFSTSTANGTLTLLGSNDDSTYVTVETIDIDNSTDQIIEDTYKYYKYSSTVTMTTVDFYETVFDRAIIYCALSIIFRSFIKEVGDVWDIQRQLAEQDYINVMTGLKFYLDSNDNQSIADETTAKAIDINFVR